MKRVSSQVGVLGLCAVLLCAVTAAQESGSQGGSTGAAPAATGPDTNTQMTENPPVSGLDEPSFEPGYGVRSYLAPRFQASESVSTNAFARLSTRPSITEITRLLGSATLQKLWKVHPLDVTYSAGGSIHTGGTAHQVHSLAATQRFLWRTGQLALRDSFTYFPEGSFGLNSYGGSGGFFGGGFGNGSGGIGGVGTGGPGIGNNTFGSLGQQPRISELALADVTQYLNPRTSVVLTGGWGLTNFVGGSSVGLINGEQALAQAGYNYQLRRHDQIAVLYGFQELHFPGSSLNPHGSIEAHLIHLMYGRRISGKLNFKAGGGPQWIQRHQILNFFGILIPIDNSVLSFSGQALMTYQVSPRTGVTLMYRRGLNTGSGFFAGANTDALRLSVNHALTQRWDVTVDSGYSRSKRLLFGSTQTANNAHTYGYWYAGGSVRRILTRQLNAFASYQYDALGFGSGFCSTTTCSPGQRGYGRHVGLIGLDWTLRPIRLD